MVGDLDKETILQDKMEWALLTWKMTLLMWPSRLEWRWVNLRRHLMHLSWDNGPKKLKSPQGSLSRRRKWIKSGVSQGGTYFMQLWLMWEPCRTGDVLMMGHWKTGLDEVSFPALCFNLHLRTPRWILGITDHFLCFFSQCEPIK